MCAVAKGCFPSFAKSAQLTSAHKHTMFKVQMCTQHTAHSTQHTAEEDITTSTAARGITQPFLCV